MCRDQIRAIGVLCIDLVLDIVYVNVIEDAENFDCFLDDSHPGRIVSSCLGARTGCNVDHQMRACLIQMCESETRCYFEENAHQYDSYLAVFRKVCDRCYQSERSIDWYVDWVACYHETIAFYYRLLCDNQRDFGVLRFPKRDLPCRD